MKSFYALLIAAGLYIGGYPIYILAQGWSQPMHWHEYRTSTGGNIRVAGGGDLIMATILIGVGSGLILAGAQGLTKKDEDQGNS